MQVKVIPNEVSHKARSDITLPVNPTDRYSLKPVFVRDLV